MKLKSFGCSFIFGSELSDDRSAGTDLIPSQLTWPAHLAQQLGLEHETHSRPGSGNLQIAERVLSHIALNDATFYAIGWTWIDRFDIWDPAGDSKHYLNNDLWFKWSTILPADHNEVAKNYFKNIQSDLRDKLTTLMYVRIVIDTLKQKNIPFVMTYMDNLMFDQEWHITSAVKELQEYVKPYMTTFDGQNFLDWSCKNNYPVSKLWHPLDEAHWAAGEYLYNNLKGKTL